jgi:hypothetical protein
MGGNLAMAVAGWQWLYDGGRVEVWQGDSGSWSLAT